MSVISVPRAYENAISVGESGALIAKIGKNALIIAGETAFSKVGDALTKTLEENGVRFETELTGGYPTNELAEYFAKRALDGGRDVIIAAGGGRIMDLSKAAADKAELPIVTIPTVPATCASWSELAVLYTNDGAEDSYLYTKRSPELIVIDRDVLRAAPKRYLISGVVDSIVKWYEVGSNFNGNQLNFELRLQLKVCELILETLEKEFVDAALQDIDHIPQEIWENAIDAVILLAGLSGSIKGNVPYGGLAHHFYNQATHVPATHVRLHGEIVMYGLFNQLIIEGVDREQLRERMRKMKALGVPVTLADLNLVENVEQNVRFIAERIAERVPDYAPAEVQLSADTIYNGIFEVDRIGREL